MTPKVLTHEQDCRNLNLLKFLKNPNLSFDKLVNLWKDKSFVDHQIIVNLLKEKLFVKRQIICRRTYFLTVAIRTLVVTIRILIRLIVVPIRFLIHTTA